MQQIMTSRLAYSTQRNHNSCFREYINFCRSHNLSAFNLMIYTTHLSTSTSYKNIKLNIAAMKHLAILYHYNSVIPPLPRLYMLIREIKRQRGNKSQRRQRPPITPALLLQLKSYLTNSGYNIYDQNMFFHAFTSPFYSFLRSSEYVPPFTQRFSSETTRNVHDVYIVNGHEEIIIKCSKADPSRNSCIMTLPNS